MKYLDKMSDLNDTETATVDCEQNQVAIDDAGSEAEVDADTEVDPQLFTGKCAWDDEPAGEFVDDADDDTSKVDTKLFHLYCEYRECQNHYKLVYDDVLKRINNFQDSDDTGEEHDWYLLNDAFVPFGSVKENIEDNVKSAVMEAFEKTVPADSLASKLIKVVAQSYADQAADLVNEDNNVSYRETSLYKLAVSECLLSSDEKDVISDLWKTTGKSKSAQALDFMFRECVLIQQHYEEMCNKFKADIDSSFYDAGMDEDRVCAIHEGVNNTLEWFFKTHNNVESDDDSDSDDEPEGKKVSRKIYETPMIDWVCMISAIALAYFAFMIIYAGK